MEQNSNSLFLPYVQYISDVSEDERFIIHSFNEGCNHFLGDNVFRTSLWFISNLILGLQISKKLLLPFAMFIE
jgi:hypothetical protein